MKHSWCSSYTISIMDDNDIGSHLEKLISLERNSELYSHKNDILAADSEDTADSSSVKTYEKPPGTYTDLILIILTNTKRRALPVSSIQDILCMLFPYYKQEGGLANGIWAAVAVKRKDPLFLRGNLSNNVAERLVILNPAQSENTKQRVQKATKRLRLTCFECMGKPELLEAIEKGKAKLDDWASENYNNLEQVQDIENIMAETNISQLEHKKKVKMDEKDKNIKILATDSENAGSSTEVKEDPLSPAVGEIFPVKETVKDEPIEEIVEEILGGTDDSGNDEALEDIKSEPLDPLDIEDFDIDSDMSCTAISTKIELKDEPLVEESFPAESKSVGDIKPDLGQSDDCHLPAESMASSHKEADKSEKTGQILKFGQLKRGHTNDGKPLAAVNHKRRRGAKKNAQLEVPEDCEETDSSNDSDDANKSSQNSSTPAIKGCIDIWKKVFPWVTYCEETCTLVCEICKMGSIYTQHYEVMVIKDQNKTYGAAKILRTHSDSIHHKDSEVKKNHVEKLLKAIYPILKEHTQEISGIKEITDLLSSQGILPNLMLKECIISYMIKHISHSLQKMQLKSLQQSPGFSVLTIEDGSLAIIRWLNKNGESEEHLFTLPKNKNKEKQTVKEFLRSNNISLQKMSYYKDVPHLQSVSTKEKLELPTRLPSLKNFLSWLENTAYFKDLFHYLETFTSLCKSTHSSFAHFPETAEIVKFEEPYSHGCLRNQKILSFFSKNSEELKAITQTIYNQTGNLEALSFTSLDLTNPSSLELSEALFPKLHEIFSKEENDQSCLDAVKEMRNLIDSRIKLIKEDKLEEEKVLTFIDIFLSYSLLGIYSKKKETVSIFFQKLSQLTTFGMEKAFNIFVPEFKGSSASLLQDIHAARGRLEKQKSCTMLELLEEVGKKAEVREAFPNLDKFHMIVKTLPCIPANQELTMFDVALAHGILSTRFGKSLVLPVAHIFIEGPSKDDLDEDFVVEEWFHEWRNHLEENRISDSSS